MALNNIKCNRLMPLHFKGLTGSALKGLRRVRQDASLVARRHLSHGRLRIFITARDVSLDTASAADNDVRSSSWFRRRLSVQRSAVIAAFVLKVSEN